MTGAQLLRLQAQGEISAETWVRAESSSTWRQLANVDLQEEQQREQKRSFWSHLWRSMSPGAIMGLICLLMFIGGMVYLSALTIKLIWPFLLFVLMIWFFKRLLSGGS